MCEGRLGPPFLFWRLAALSGFGNALAVGLLGGYARVWLPAACLSRQPASLPAAPGARFTRMEAVQHSAMCHRLASDCSGVGWRCARARVLPRACAGTRCLDTHTQHRRKPNVCTIEPDRSQRVVKRNSPYGRERSRRCQNVRTTSSGGTKQRVNRCNQACGGMPSFSKQRKSVPSEENPRRPLEILRFHTASAMSRHRAA